MASSVDSLIAFAFPVFSIERFGSVMPIASASSLERFFLVASMTSIFIIIAIVCSYTVYFLSSSSFTPSPITHDIKINITAKNITVKSHESKEMLIYRSPGVL